nr:reverse transcriptase domain-containing protein [Salicibibacter kimchii]
MLYSTINSKFLSISTRLFHRTSRGTAQGGVISPLLSNVVLNELDWWISNQWETFEPQRANSIGFRQYARKYTKLKDGYIVRYADDFKIMCRTYQGAKRFYYATVDFLKSRLGLEVNEQKSNVVNLKKNASDFLGFKLKIVKQNKARHGYVAKTSMSDKAISKTKRILKNRIKEIQHEPTADTVKRFNITLVGIQNYYRYATTICKDLTEVNYTLLKSIKPRLKKNATIVKFSETSVQFRRKTKGIRPSTKTFSVQGAPLLPITGVHRKNPQNFSQTICNYTIEGRNKVHKGLKAIPRDVLTQVMNTYSKSRSIAYNDNRISTYIAQYGRCYVTGEPVGVDRIHCHHVVPRDKGGSDKYSNLIIIDTYIHRLIHITNIDKIAMYLRYFNLNKKQMDKLNSLRKTSGNEPITT